MASGHDFEPVTLNWELAGQASESLAADILHNFHGRQLCDSEILDEQEVARPVFQAFTSSIQLAMLNKEWTRSQRSDQLQNGWGAYPARVDVFLSSDGDRLEHWIHTGEEVDEDGATDMDDDCCLLQTTDGMALVAGCSMCHPYVICNLFGFANSDGSTDPLRFDTSSARALVQSLMRISETYAYEQEH